MTAPNVATDTDPMRVVVVGTDRTFAELLAGALDAAGMAWVGTAHSARDGIELSRRLQPDVVVIEIEMPYQDGLEATRRIRAAASNAVVVVMTGAQDFSLVFRAGAAGASGFISKQGSLVEMLGVLSRARQGHMVVAPSAFAARSAEPAPSHGTGSRSVLTRRECDVLGGLCKGMQVQAIATALGISPEACRGSVRSLNHKLGTHTQLATVVRAQQLGLVDSPRARPRTRRVDVPAYCGR